MRLALILLGLVLAFPCLAIAADERSDYAVPKGFVPEVGSAFPDFRLEKFKGGLSARSEYDGAITVLNFYTTHCGPCHRDVPALNQFMAEHPHIRVVSITPDDAAETAAYVAARGLTGPILINAQGALDAWGVQYFPSFAIIGADGSLVDATYGNRLGGEDGTVTAAGLARWVKRVASKT